MAYKRLEVKPNGVLMSGAGAKRVWTLLTNAANWKSCRRKQFNAYISCPMFGTYVVKPDYKYAFRKYLWSWGQQNPDKVLPVGIATELKSGILSADKLDFLENNFKDFYYGLNKFGVLTSVIANSYVVYSHAGYRCLNAESLSKFVNLDNTPCKLGDKNCNWVKVKASKEWVDTDTKYKACFVPKSFCSAYLHIGDTVDSILAINDKSALLEGDAIETGSFVVVPYTNNDDAVLDLRKAMIIPGREFKACWNNTGWKDVLDTDVKLPSLKPLSISIGKSSALTDEKALLNGILKLQAGETKHWENIAEDCLVNVDVKRRRGDEISYAMEFYNKNNEFIGSLSEIDAEHLSDVVHKAHLGTLRAYNHNFTPVQHDIAYWLKMTDKMHVAKSPEEKKAILSAMQAAYRLKIDWVSDYIRFGEVVFLMTKLEGPYYDVGITDEREHRHWERVKEHVSIFDLPQVFSIIYSNDMKRIRSEFKLIKEA